VKRYSIAEARNKLPHLVHAAEAGTAVELTRRGKPVAVLVALEAYQRLNERKRGFKQLYRAFLRRHPDFVHHAMEAEDWLHDVRDSSPGRDFTW
jgi:antitoxin Phd